MMYDAETLEVGRTEKEKVRSVLMPRRDFVQYVERCIDSLKGWSEDQITMLREEVIPVAETMPRFPFGTWINTTRGCGCIIGEYLVARKQIDRIAFLRKHGGGLSVETPTIQELLVGNPIASLLQTFGQDIDSMLREVIEEDGYDIDPRGWSGGIQSIEIIDE